MMQEILQRYNPWWERHYSIEGVKRNDYLEKMETLRQTKDVVFITGLRRTGKTTIIHHYIKRLIENEVDPRDILYFSMDHPALMKESIHDILDEFRRIHSHPFEKKIMVFIDDVHLKDDFEMELKNIYDMGNVKVYASGSSSIFLLEKGAYLTGRQRFIQVNPFNFQEYLKLHDIEVLPSNNHLLVKYAEDYVREGGMPEFLQRKDPEYILTLIDSVIYKDIALRHSIKNVAQLKDILLLLSQSIGGRLSTRKISNILGISHESVREYLSFFEETYLFRLVERAGKISLRKANMRKIYLADTGIVEILSPTVNMGSLVENAVFNHLVKNGNVNYDLKNGKEIDFIQKDHAFEVKYKDKIEKEDLNSMADYNIPNKFIITRTAEGKIEDTILIPLWKFLLDVK